MLEGCSEDDAALIVRKRTGHEGLKIAQVLSLHCAKVRRNMGFSSNEQVIEFLPLAWRRYQENDSGEKVSLEQWITEAHYLDDRREQQPVDRCTTTVATQST